MMETAPTTLSKVLGGYLRSLPDFDEPLEEIGDAVYLRGRSVALRPHVLEAPRPAPDVFVCHLHVDLRLGTRTIDSCVLGVGSSLQEAASQALELWASLVGVLVLSFLKQREFEGTDHFDPEQAVPWGVPGMHGFVGPVWTRGMETTDGLGEGSFFSAGASELVKDLPTPNIHLVKSMLQRDQGARWVLRMELNGHERRMEVPAGPDLSDLRGDGYAVRYCLLILP